MSGLCRLLLKWVYNLQAQGYCEFLFFKALVNLKSSTHPNLNRPADQSVTLATKEETSRGVAMRVF